MNNNEQLHTSNDLLTREEKIRMRRVVWSYMEMRPRRAKAPAAAVRRFPAFLFSPRLVASALVLALFASSAGVSLAAENSLPGDLLYPVKTDINEPVQGALATSASAKAAWASSVADERVKEAATLAAEGRLSSSTQQELAQNFDAHADIAINAIASEASTSPDVGAQAAVGFQAQLSEYQQVLADVEGSPQQAGAEASSTLSSDIAQKQARLAAIHAQAQALLSLADSASGTESVAAAHMRTAAQTQLETSLSLARQASGALNSSSSAEVALQLESASGTISAGSAYLQNNASQQALGDFENALSAAEKIGAFLETSSAIHHYTGLVVGQPSTSTPPSPKHGVHHTHAGTATTSASTASTTATVQASTSATSSDNESGPNSSSAAQGQSKVHGALSLPIPVPSF